MKFPDTEGADLLPVLRIKINYAGLWMGEGHNRFVCAVRKHGLDYEKITQETGKTLSQIEYYRNKLMKKLKSIPHHEDSDILPVLS